MLTRMYHCFQELLLTLALITNFGFAASGTVEGTVRDSQTGEPLPGANVMIVKTSLGASTDINGKYTIREIPPGSYTLRATYVGYRQKEVSIQVKEEQTLKQEFKLNSVDSKEKKWLSRRRRRGRKKRSTSNWHPCR